MLKSPAYLSANSEDVRSLLMKGGKPGILAEVLLKVLSGELRFEPSLWDEETIQTIWFARLQYLPDFQVTIQHSTGDLDQNIVQNECLSKVQIERGGGFNRRLTFYYAKSFDLNLRGYCGSVFEVNHSQTARAISPAMKAPSQHRTEQTNHQSLHRFPPWIEIEKAKGPL